MSRADLIPLALLRDLAARLPDPIRPASFVDLAVYVSRTAPASTAPAPAVAAAPATATGAPGADVAPAPVAINKKGLPWTLEELQQARELLTGGKGPSEVARILGRPVAATQIAIKRYGVRGIGPITVPGRPKGRFKKADPADALTPARKAKAAPAKAAPKIAPVAPLASSPAPKPAAVPEPTPQEADPKQARIRATLQVAIAENQPGRQIRVLSHLLMRITGLSLDLSASDGVIKVELESDDAAAYPFTRPEEGMKPSAPARSENGRQPIPAPVIGQVTVNSDGNTLFLSGVVGPIACYAFGVQFRRSPNGPWSRAEFNQDTGYWRTPDLADGRLYDVRARRFFPGLTSLLWERQSDITRASPWTVITGIQVIADQTPPAAPELIQAGIEGNRLVFSFAPHLGANYAQTAIWRGPNGNFANATFIRRFYVQASTVQGSVALSASPQTYFLGYSNGSGIVSAPVNIGTY